MSRWSIKVERFKEVIFEVLETNTEWSQFAGVEASPGREYRLDDTVGSQVRVGFSAGDSIVSFVPYSRDSSGKIRESLMRCYSETTAHLSWLLRTEAGDGVDYDDYIVRVTVADAAKDSVEEFTRLLDTLKYDRPTIT